MHRPLLVAVLWLCSAAGASMASSQSADQSTRLQAALDAQGCAGGSVNVGESGFEIVGAMCGGRVYDLMLDHEFRLMRKDARN